MWGLSSVSSALAVRSDRCGMPVKQIDAMCRVFLTGG
jgi:hypothetical protein